MFRLKFHWIAEGLRDLKGKGEKGLPKIGRFIACQRINITSLAVSVYCNAKRYERGRGREGKEGTGNTHRNARLYAES